MPPSKTHGAASCCVIFCCKGHWRYDCKQMAPSAPNLQPSLRGRQEETLQQIIYTFSSSHVFISFNFCWIWQRTDWFHVVAYTHSLNRICCYSTHHYYYDWNYVKLSFITYYYGIDYNYHHVKYIVGNNRSYCIILYLMRCKLVNIQRWFVYTSVHVWRHVCDSRGRSKQRGHLLWSFSSQ